MENAGSTSDVERAICRKELDLIVADQEERQYNEDWIDNREKEKGQAGGDGSTGITLMDFLFKLRVDIQDNDPNTAALCWKRKGNKYFQESKFQDAILAYSLGITQNPNRELKASLYNNRSATDFHMKKYRAALGDCEMALRFNPKHEKVLARAEMCRQKLLESGESLTPETKKNEIHLVIRSEYIEVGKGRVLNKHERRRSNNLLIRIIKQRNVRFSSGRIDLASLTPSYPQLKGYQVSFIDGRLVWPAYLLYPDFGLVIFIQQFYENECFNIHMESVCEALNLNNNCRKYVPEFFRLYFQKGADVFRFSSTKTLKEIASLECFSIENGTAHFIVILKEGKQEKLLLADPNLVIVN